MTIDEILAKCNSCDFPSAEEVERLRKMSRNERRVHLVMIGHAIAAENRERYEGRLRELGFGEDLPSTGNR